MLGNWHLLIINFQHSFANVRSTSVTEQYPILAYCIWANNRRILLTNKGFSALIGFIIGQALGHYFSSWNIWALWQEYLNCGCCVCHLMHPINEIRGSKSKNLAGKCIVLGITGSIAAIECVKLARELARHGARVIPVMSKSATKIIHPDSIHFATGLKPIIELDGAIKHVELCGDTESRADLLLIAPATANTI